MDPFWAIARGLMGAQIFIAFLTLVGLCLPLTRPLAQWVHRRRGLLLTGGVAASVLPVIYAGALAAEVDYMRAYFLKYLLISLGALAAQVGGYWLDDRRTDPTNPASRMRM